MLTRSLIDRASKLDRRGFLTTSLGAGLAGIAPVSSVIGAQTTKVPGGSYRGPPATEYERTIASSRCLRVLGYPTSWSLVQDRFLPLSPDRVAILPTPNGKSTYGPFDCLRYGDNRVATAVGELAEEYDRDWKTRVSVGKMSVILRIIYEMTTYYQRTDLFRHWASGLAAREHLGSTGTGDHFGWVHQFQRGRGITPVNGTVDWWLFLVPEGCCFDSCDGKPVNLLIGYVFPSPCSPRLQLEVYLTAKTVGSLGQSVVAVSQMDRISAARFVNEHVVRVLKAVEKNPWWS